jgi:hypothetical protein
MRPFGFGLAVGLVLFSSSSFAQNFQLAKGEIRVNTNFNFSQSVSATDKEALADMETSARKAIYAIVGNECKLLLDTIASECRPESININSNLQNQNFRSDAGSQVLNTTANAGFRVMLKGQSDGK